MTRKKQHCSTAAPAATANAPKPKEKKVFLLSRLGKGLPYLLTFLTLWIFCTFTYGDVFTRTVQESFVCSDYESMKFLTAQDNGTLYYYGRYLLLILHNQWIGGLVLSIVLTATVFLMDYALHVPRWLRGVSALIPFGLLLIWVNKGMNIYYRNEPSLFILEVAAVFILAISLAFVARLLFHHFFPSKAIITPEGWKRWSIGSFIVALSFISLNIYTLNAGENTILTARMQNRILDNDIPALIEDGLSAKRPSKSVAAYYAIGLVQTEQLLEHIFDIKFDFPEVHIDTPDNSGEYGIFTADCNFFSGLLNASYRSAIDQIVMTGPRLYYLKRAAICSILNQEKKLAYKYLNLIAKVPFESEFVETYRPMVEHPEMAAQHPVYSKVLGLLPLEQRFEQNYREPTFLGYHVGMQEGNNAALSPSIAACLYSKDLPNMALRAKQYKKIKGNLPMAVEEALAILAQKDPTVYSSFPELDEGRTLLPHPANVSIKNFFMSIQELYHEKYKNDANWREKMSIDLKNGISEDFRNQLFAEWRGHYVYYYYCENVTQKAKVKKEESGVN